MAIRSPLNIISLCTGGGGLDLGVELAIRDARPVVLVEREAFSVTHLVQAMEQGCMAPAPVWSDVQTFNGRPWRGVVDGVIGGIPCQPHSVAGKRLGEDDERDLWSDARRIIVQSGAWFALIENVQGMLSTGGAERVWRDLRRLGFDGEIGLFTSAEVGAPHERARVFILAVVDADGRHAARWRAGRNEAACGRAYGELAGPSENVGHHDRAGLERRQRGECGECAGEWSAGQASGELADAEGVRSRGIPIQQGRQVEESCDPDRCCNGGQLAYSIGCGHDGVEENAVGRSIRRTSAERSKRDDLPLYPPGPGDIDGWRAVIERAPQFEPAVCRMADGMASRLDRLRMLGNGVNPLQAAYALRTLATRLARRSSAASLLVRMMEKP